MPREGRGNNPKSPRRQYEQNSHESEKGGRGGDGETRMAIDLLYKTILGNGLDALHEQSPTTPRSSMIRTPRGPLDTKLSGGSKYFGSHSFQGAVS